MTVLRSWSVYRSVCRLIVLLAAGPAGLHAAGRRLALVIGNNAYRHTAVLQNCAHDASAMGEALTSLGFEVKTILDADRRRGFQCQMGRWRK